ncbi:MAG: hypothetical protein NC318_13105, partial [Blautia sp.]|nr:hypothetical protein [Blautia sp.]
QHNNGTETHTMTCLACGYSVAEDCTYDENNAKSNEDDTHTLTCSACGSAKIENCSGGTATYTEKAVCELCKHEYGELLKDSGAPTGEISIRTSKWNSFLNTVTFGLFFKNTEKVTITAADQESGVKSIAYYISDSGMTEKQVKALTTEWKNVDGDTVAFNISEDKSCVVYAKITDNQGNMTYLSSDGMVFDGTAPSISGVINGKAYCEQQIVTAKDENLESVTINGEKADLQDGGKELSLTLDIASGVQTIEAKDKAGNTTTVTVNMGHHYGTEWESDETQHWHECSNSNCDERSDVAAHTKDSGTVTKPPTETETGIRIYKCTVCGYVWREKIEKQPSGSGGNNGSGNNGNGNNGQGNNNNQESINNILETSSTNTAASTLVETTGVKPKTDTTKPGNESKQENVQQSGNAIEGREPFIKGADGRIGGDVIRAEEESGENISASAPTETLESGNTADSEINPRTGAPWSLWWFAVSGIVVFIIGIGVFFVVKRKRENS